MRSAGDATGLPLRAGTLFFDGNAKGEVATLVAVEVQPPAGRRHVKLVAEARRADGGAPVHQQFEETVDVRDGSPVVVAREWRLPPGVWQMRVLAEDAGSGHVGTAIHTFEVPAAAGLRVSTPILTDEVEKEKGAARPRLTLRRAFAPRGRLYCQFSVYDSAGRPPALPRVTAAWELRREGALLHEGAPTAMEPTADGRLARLFGLSLEGAAPGDVQSHPARARRGQRRDGREDREVRRIVSDRGRRRAMSGQSFVTRVGAALARRASPRAEAAPRPPRLRRRTPR